MIIAFMLWIIAAAIFEMIGIPLLFPEQNSPMCIPLILGVAALIPASNEPSAVLARAFGECREGRYVPVAHAKCRPKRSVDHIPRCSAALQA